MRSLWFNYLCVPVALWAVTVLPVSAAEAPTAPALQALHDRIQQDEIPNVHSVLVAQDGKTIAEWYFPGRDERRGVPLGTIAFGPETLHDIRSASKSVVALLFGIALSQGAVKSLDAPVLDYFPEYRDLQTADRRKIRLRDLLTMTSGLHWDEQTYSYLDPRNSETAMDLAPDRMRHILSQAIEAPPGTRWTYSGGDVALIAVVIARATKKPIEVFARDNLFTPLGINAFEWLKDGKGVPYAASGLRLRPRDMLKIGQMMLDGGRFNGREIVPASWIEAATAPHASVDSDGECPTRYGYFWWLWLDCKPGPGYYAAMGNGGQRIFLMPAKKLVIVITAGLYNDEKQGMMRLITRGVINAVPTPAP